MYARLDRSKPCPFPLPAQCTYLGEDENGYYHMDGFFDGIGNMFKRMVKFTPKSFTPGNIFKAVRNTTLTTMTGGIYLALPKNIKKTMENVANVAMPIAAAGITAAIVGPSVMSALGPKLSSAASLLGKNVSTIGKTVFGALGKLSPAGQSEVVNQIKPDDIVYAERNGVLPSHIQALIDQAERDTYAYAAAQQSNMMLRPTNAMLAPPENAGVPSVYYGLIEENRKKMEEAQALHSDQLVTVSAMAGGALLLILLMKK